MDLAYCSLHARGLLVRCLVFLRNRLGFPDRQSLISPSRRFGLLSEARSQSLTNGATVESREPGSRRSDGHLATLFASTIALGIACMFLSVAVETLGNSAPKFANRGPGAKPCYRFLQSIENAPVSLCEATTFSW